MVNFMLVPFVNDCLVKYIEKMVIPASWSNFAWFHRETYILNPVYYVLLLCGISVPLIILSRVPPPPPLLSALVTYTHTCWHGAISRARPRHS